MDHEELMELILDHYKNPRNYGAVKNASVVQEGGNPGCGDIVTVYMDVDEDGVIKKASFEGEGCMVSQSGTSLILEGVEGKTVSEIEEMSPAVVTQILGKRLVTTRPKCAYLGFNTLKTAVKQWRVKNMSESLSRERSVP
ncbi:MAG: iron-sulfur cluster assembly scaffold protein [Deltaproteobacteria bacterium]